MKQYFTRICLILLTNGFLQTPLFTQSFFQQLYTADNSPTFPSHIAAGIDGSWWGSGALLTDPQSFDSGREGLLWKFDKSGNLLWTKRMQPATSSLDNMLTDIEPTPDGGCIVLMYDRVNAINAQTIPWMIKFNADGETVWVKKATGFTKIILNEIRKVSNGYLISGTGEGADSSPLIKIKENGDILWGKIFRGYTLYCDGAFEMPGGDLNIPAGNTGGGRLFTDKMGNIKLFATYRDTSAALEAGESFRLCTLAGDSLLFAGFDPKDRSIIFLKTDKLGNAGRSARLKVPGFELYPGKMMQTPDGSLLLSFTLETNLPSAYIGLINITPDLKINWTRKFGKPDDTYLGQAHTSMAENGDLLIAGYLQDNSNIKMYLSRTDAQGVINGGCCSLPFEVVLSEAGFGPVGELLSIDTIPVFVNSVVNSAFRPTSVEPYCEVKQSVTLSETDICPASCIDITVSNPNTYSQYNWAFPAGTPDTSSSLNPSQICYFTLGEYPVYLSQDGCLIDSALLTVSKIPDQFPNAFTPNNDGKNDVFRPVFYCPVEDFFMQIFNRWGERIFETTDPVAGWDGTINGNPAPMDVYIFKIRYLAYDGESDSKVLKINEMKEVTLLR